jgi:uncharacterized protein CbrC (UPF0167 family)
MACPGSLKMEEPFPDTSSVYADEGTAAHQLMEWCLTSGQDASAYAGRLIEIEESGRKFEVDEDMVLGVQGYCDYVRGLGGDMLVEQVVDLSPTLAQPDAYGTADTIVIVDDTLHIIDLKYGRNYVAAEDNKQLMLYGLGALDLASLAYDIKRVVLTIYQPKVSMEPSTFDMPVEDLLEFAGEARIGAAHAVYQLNGGRKPELNPGASQCQWCKAKAVCPALAAETTAVVTTAASVDDFADLTTETLPAALAEVPSDVLAEALTKVDLMEMFCLAVRAETERRLLAGVEVPGFKLVEGKRGHRKWVNPEEAELQLRSMRLKVEEMFELKLISPTTAEKLAKAGTIGPRQWKKLQEQYAQSQGKPSVALASDKRPALSLGATMSDFALIEEPLV